MVFCTSIEIIKYKKYISICLCPHLLWFRTAALAFSESFADGIRTKWQKTEEEKKKIPRA